MAKKDSANRADEVLFIDARKLGALIPGSRKQKQLTDKDLEQVAAVYREFKTTGVPEAISGFYSIATTNDIADHKYALVPGRYVGSSNGDDGGEDIEERMPRLLAELASQFRESENLEKEILANLDGIISSE